MVVVAVVQKIGEVVTVTLLPLAVRALLQVTHTQDLVGVVPVLVKIITMNVWVL